MVATYSLPGIIDNLEVFVISVCGLFDKPLSRFLSPIILLYPFLRLE